MRRRTRRVNGAPDHAWHISTAIGDGSAHYGTGANDLVTRPAQPDVDPSAHAFWICGTWFPRGSRHMDRA